MEIIEIVLILLGIVVFVLSFLVPAGRNEEVLAPEVSEEFVREMVEKKVEGARSQVEEIVGETINYAMEKTERSMERLTNEKMMAVNEYSDTVLEEINKSHQEVVFLYDMLNDKHENLKTTVSEVTRTASEVKQAVKDAEIVAKETEEKARETEAKVIETETRVNMTEAKVREAEAKAKETEARYAEALEITREAEAKIREAKESVDETLTASLRARELMLSPVVETGEEELEEEEFYYDQENQEQEIEFEPIAAPVVEVSYQPPLEDDMAELRNSLGLAAAYEVPDEESWLQEGPYAGEETVVMAKEAEVSVEAPEEYIDDEEESGRNNKERILTLHRKGMSNVAIAKELALGVGEVKLVIDLFEGI